MNTAPLTVARGGSAKQPGVHRKDGGIQAESDKDEHGGPVGEPDIGERGGAALDYVENDAGQQAQAAEKVPHEVTECRSRGGRLFSGKNQKYRCDGKYFPEDVQRKKIAGKRHAQLGETALEKRTPNGTNR